MRRTPRAAAQTPVIAGFDTASFYKTRCKFFVTRHDSSCGLRDVDLGLQQELKLRLTKCGRSAIFIGLLCPVLNASDIDLKLTTHDGSSQVSVVNDVTTNVAAIDSSGNITFNASLMPNGLSGTAGQVLRSNGPNLAPTWVPPLLDSTNTWTAGQTYMSSVTVSSNLVVNSGGIISGNGSGLTNLQPGIVSTGTLPNYVVVSSIAANTVYPAAVSTGVYGAIWGLGNQVQALNMGNMPINGVGGPTANTDAATKAYVDAATGTVSTALQAYVATATNTVDTSLDAYVDTATGSVNASMISYVNTATGNVNTSMTSYVNTSTGNVNTSMISYVDTATGSVKTSIWGSAGNWTAQQTYTKEIFISTSMALTGAFIAGGSAGSSGNTLLSMGSGAAPQWVSTSTFLGGLPIVKQGSASLNFAVTTSADYYMTSANFAILADASLGNVNIHLPSATGNLGMMLFIVRKDNSGFSVNIVGSGADSIEGATPVTWGAGTQFSKRLLISDGGSVWYVISN